MCRTREHNGDSADSRQWVSLKMPPGAARSNPLDLAAQGRLVKKEAIAALAKQGHPCMFPSVVL